MSNSNIVNIPGREPQDRPAIEAEARAWLVQLDGHRPPPQELGEFREWLARSPLHREAFRQAAAAWNHLDSLSGLLDGDSREQRRVQSAGTGLLTRLSARPAAAALLAVCLVAALAVYLNTPASLRQSPYVADYGSGVGEVRTVSLPDGSSVRLNTHSHIEVAFDDESRNIHLSDGEAWFEVAHNPDRPFLVYAGKVVVRAVGTAFSVHVRDRKVDLTITEGRVEVASLKEALPSLAGVRPDILSEARSRVPLSQGQHMVFDDDIELVQRMAPEQIEKRLSWRDGMLVFDNDTLEDVVAEINRYTSARIVISDSGLRDLRLGGYFQASDTASILATLQENFGIRVDRVRPDLIYLSRRRDTP